MKYTNEEIIKIEDKTEKTVKTNTDKFREVFGVELDIVDCPFLCEKGQKCSECKYHDFWDKEFKGADAERDFQNSDYWNDYLAQVIKDAKADAIDSELMASTYMKRTKQTYQEGIEKGRADAIKEYKYNVELFREIFLEELERQAIDREEIFMYRNICSTAWNKYLEQLKGAE